MLIKDVLRQKGYDIATVDANASSLEALQMFNQKHIGSLLVTDNDGSLTGILSERDILSRFAQVADGITVGRIMTPRADIIVAQSRDTIESAMSAMTEHRVRHLPVLEDGELVGVVSIGDLLKAVLSDLEFETKLLEDYIAGSQAIIH